MSTHNSLSLFSDHGGHSSLVSFKWLKDEKKLREGWRPRCEASQEILPSFTSGQAQLTEEGVFVQQLSFLRPGHFCVDGRLDDTSQAEPGLQPSYTVVVACQDRLETTGPPCPLSSPACHSRCCQPWQVWHPALTTCRYSKSKHSRRNRY